MPEFLVEATTFVRDEIKIEAETKEGARRKARNGEGEIVDFENLGVFGVKSVQHLSPEEEQG